MSIADTRRQNLQLLVDQHGGQVAFARATGKNAVNVNQFCTGVRNVGEAAARGIEKALGLPLGWLDTPRTEATPESPFPSEAWEQLDSGAQAFLLTAIDYFRLSNKSTADESELLAAYRTCSKEAREVVLSVALAQSSQSRKGRKA